MKRRIKSTIWGNWYGYEGTRRTREFSDTPYGSAETHAAEWLAGNTEIDDILAANAAEVKANGGVIKLWHRTFDN